MGSTANSTPKSEQDPRFWLTAHEAGHLVYAEIQSVDVARAIACYPPGGGMTETLRHEHPEEFFTYLIAAGAAGEFMVCELELGSKPNSSNFIDDVLDRARIDKQEFYRHLDPINLSLHGLRSDVSKDNFFVKFAYTNVLPKIKPHHEFFIATRDHLFDYGFIGNRAIKALRKGSPVTRQMREEDLKEFSEEQRSNILRSYSIN